MNTQKRKYITILTLFCLLISLFAGTTSFAFAYDSFDSTNVMDDLYSADGFNLMDYQPDPQGAVTLCNFVEYGFNYKQDNSTDYGLYLYVYNPRLIDFDTATNRNTVSLAITKNGITTEYKTYELQFLSKSTKKENNVLFTDNLFYKFKVKNADEILRLVDKNARIYNIASIELLTKGETNLKDYQTGGTYTVTGYAKGLGNGNTTSSLHQTISELLTLELDCHTTFFRTQTSPKGRYYQNQITSMYFAIPNKVLDTYGGVNKIFAQTYKQRSAPFIVTKDKTFYDKLRNYLGKTIPPENDNTIDEYLTSYHKEAVGGTYVYEWGWNNGYLWGTSHGGSQSLHIRNRLDYLTGVFYTNNSDMYVPGKQVMQEIFNYSASYNNGKCFNGVSNDLHSSVLSKDQMYKKYVVSADDKTDLLDYDSTHTWWDKLNDYGFINIGTDTSEELKEVEGIRTVSTKDIIKDKEQLSKNLLVAECDIDEMSAYVITNKLKNNTTYLMRFDFDDYYSIPMSHKYISGDVFGESTADTYLYQEPLFYDLQIIEVQFYRDGKYTNIPVVSNPTNYAGGGTKPVDPKSLWELFVEWLKNNWQWIVLALVLLLCLPFLPNILLFVFKLLVAIIKLPFVLVKKTYELCKQKALKREQANNINALQAIQDLERYEARNEANQSKPKAKRKRKRTNNST